MTLTPAQIDAIRKRTGPETQRGIPKDTQRRRQLQIAGIRQEAKEFGENHLDDAAFVAGVVLYWAEGAKTRNFLDLANTDPVALRAFIRWVRTYLDPQAVFNLRLHLHHGNDENSAKAYRANALEMPNVRFGKTHIKAPGSGHRKNQLPHGVCRVRTEKAADHWNRVMTWINVAGERLGPIDGPTC